MPRRNTSALDLASRQSRQESEREFEYYNVKRFVLHPGQWAQFVPLPSLSWTRVKFESANRRTVPDNATGVYSFVVEPEIAQHPSVKYLLYIGKAAKQSLRARYDQYFLEVTKPKRREHIAQMLEKWPSNLWFYFAEVKAPANVQDVEEALLSSFIPPHNRTFPADIRTSVKRIFG